MIKIGILGYGNIGKGVETAIHQNPDMELVAIFTRRNPKDLKTITETETISISEIEKWKDNIDVLILCGGSATDLPEQGPQYAKMFNTIDSFDTHAKVFEYYNKMDKSARRGQKLSIISVGWDPGLFSINRLYSEAILPNGTTYTFWGKGVSQGHSDAIRRIPGVKNAIQYTIPITTAMEKVRTGATLDFNIREKHIRECFVVVECDVDKKEIEEKIKTMPDYFENYDTIVHFISEEELSKNHNTMSHGGFVIRSGKTGINQVTKQIVEYSLKLDSNPEFTSSILVAYARAVYKLHKMGEIGARTVLDIPPAMLTNRTQKELLKTII